MNRFLFTLLALLCVNVLCGKVYDVTDFGAVGDSVTISSPAINRAIGQAAGDGGGIVYIPAGTYACYSIRLQSHINIYLEQGATLLAAEPAEQAGYDHPEPNDFDSYQDFGHSHWRNSLMWGIGLEDITISGPGRIDGRGLTRNTPRKPGVGNKAIALKECKNITLRDFSMYRCGHFALLATGVDNLTITGLFVDSNRDGFDIDACKNVRISRCTVNTPWDDAIVLKASYALGYFKDTENVTISDCLVSGYDRGTALDATWQRNDPQAPDRGFVTGRIKIGTETSGSFRNIAITNCIFDRCRGLALESVDGGCVEDITISNITMCDIVNSPVFLRLGSRLRSPEGTPVGKMRRILISDVNVYNADSQYSSVISGIPGHCVENVTLRNINIYHKGGYTAADGNIIPPEKEAEYPEPRMFGTIPAKGFYFRHARNIELDGVRFHYEKPDGRPLFVSHDADDIRLGNIRIDGKPYIGK